MTHVFFIIIFLKIDTDLQMCLVKRGAFFFFLTTVIACCRHSSCFSFVNDVLHNSKIIFEMIFSCIGYMECR